MGENKSKGKNILEIILIIYLIFCVIASAFWIYRKYFAPEIKTEMQTYLNEIEDTNGKRCIVQAVYYENKDNSGVELLDVKLSGYSDTKSKNIVSFGVQIIGDFEKLKQTDELSQVVGRGFLGIATTINRSYSFIGDELGQQNANSGMLCFYEESDNLNYKAVDSAFDDFGSILVKINDVNYRFCLGYARDEMQFLWENHRWTSSLSEFVKSIYEKIGSCPVGQSKHTFGFKDMFKVMKEENNEFVNITNQDDIYNYCYVDFTHYTSGAKTANDSLFKQIQYNTNYVYLNNSLLDEHFSDESIYYLTEQNCTFTYNSTTNQHDFDISSATYNEYKNKNLNYKLVIDKDYLDSINVVLGNLKSNSNLVRHGLTKYYIKENGVITGVTV